MKSILLSGLPVVVAIFLPLSGYCSSEVVAHVLAVGTYGNGNVYISLDQSIDEPGCPMPYIELPGNGPAAKAAFTTATLAIATNSTVRAKTDGCFNEVPSFTGARQSFIVVNKP